MEDFTNVFSKKVPKLPSKTKVKFSIDISRVGPINNLSHEVCLHVKYRFC